MYVGILFSLHKYIFKIFRLVLSHGQGRRAVLRSLPPWVKKNKKKYLIIPNKNAMQLSDVDIADCIE